MLHIQGFRFSLSILVSPTWDPSPEIKVPESISQQLLALQAPGAAWLECRQCHQAQRASASRTWESDILQPALHRGPIPRTCLQIHQKLNASAGFRGPTGHCRQWWRPRASLQQMTEVCTRSRTWGKSHKIGPLPSPPCWLSPTSIQVSRLFFFCRFKYSKSLIVTAFSRGRSSSASSKSVLCISEMCSNTSTKIGTLTRLLSFSLTPARHRSLGQRQHVWRLRFTTALRCSQLQPEQQFSPVRGTNWWRWAITSAKVKQFRRRCWAPTRISSIQRQHTTGCALLLCSINVLQYHLFMMKLLCMLLAMKQYDSHLIALLWRLDFINLILQKGDHCYKFLTVGLENTMNKP